MTDNRPFERTSSSPLSSPPLSDSEEMEMETSPLFAQEQFFPVTSADTIASIGSMQWSPLMASGESLAVDPQTTRMEPSSTRRPQEQRRNHQTRTKAPKGAQSVSVACTACRSRHLKCDGRRPCSRCVADRADCSYVQSRRGWKGPRRHKNTAAMSSDLNVPGLLTSELQRPTSLGISHAVDTNVLSMANVTTETISTSPDGQYSFQFIRPTALSQTNQLLPPPIAQFSSENSPGNLRSAFYQYFFPAHPFVLPPNQMTELLQRPNMEFLDYALRYIGAFYVKGVNRNMIEAQLSVYLGQVHTDNNPWIVQALLLWAIGLHMTDEDHLSTKTLKQAINRALELRMNDAKFADSVGGLSTVQAECFRRTWWELYVLDGLTGGVMPHYTPKLGSIGASVPFPVEDQEYLSGIIISIPQTIADFEEANLLSEDTIFSSAAYRIEAVRIIHMALANGKEPDAAVADQIDTKLANWILNLPDCKASIIDPEGNFDAVMATAHFMIAACSILIHRPRSDLIGDDVKAVTTCINSHNALESAAKSRNMHTAKAMQAARDISILIKTPCPLVRHSPYFTCAITMAAVTYLSYWSFIATEETEKQVKSHIELQIGSLKQLAKAIPVASTVLGQVRSVARDIFRSRKALANLYSGLSREEVFTRMMEETTGSSCHDPIVAFQ